jgi:hypothetical protein
MTEIAIIPQKSANQESTQEKPKKKTSREHEPKIIEAHFTTKVELAS